MKRQDNHGIRCKSESSTSRRRRQLLGVGVLNRDGRRELVLGLYDRYETHHCVKVLSYRILVGECLRHSNDEMHKSNGELEPLAVRCHLQEFDSYSQIKLTVEKLL